MPLRPVPWAIGNGAENSVELARVGLYAGTGAATGVIEPGDFKVSALPVPGAAVRASKGTGVIKSTYPGVFGQSYGVQEQSHEDIPVAATGSSGAAKKYAYVLIEDTQYSGQEPDSVEDGPYNNYHVTTTLPQNQPYLLLAEINQPKSTATITNAMITDRREIAVPFSKPELRTYALLSGDSSNLTTTTGGDGQQSGGQTWPVAVEAAWGEVKIPEKANYMRIVMMWTGVRSTGGKVTGFTWVQVGATSNDDNVKTQVVRYDFASPSNVSRETLVAADMKKVPKSMRGTLQKFYPRGNRDPISDSGKFLTLDGGSAMVLQLEFLQQVE